MSATIQTDQATLTPSTPQPPQASGLRQFMTDGLIIALTLSVGYLWTFSFDLGVCSYFDIPLAFISLSQTNVLFWGGSQFLGLICFGLVFALILYTFYCLGRAIDRYSAREPAREIYLMIVMIAIYSIIFSILFIFPSTVRINNFLENPLVAGVFVVLSLIWVIGVIRIFVWPLFTQRGENSYWDKLIADTIRSRQARASLSPSVSPRRWDIIAIVFLVFVVLAGVYGGIKAGRTSFREAKAFQVIAAESPRPEVAVVRVYGDYILAVPFNRTTREFEKKLYILKVSDLPKVSLIRETIGPLVPKPQSGV